MSGWQISPPTQLPPCACDDLTLHCYYCWFNPPTARTVEILDTLWLVGGGVTSLPPPSFFSTTGPSHTALPTCQLASKWRRWWSGEKGVAGVLASLPSYGRSALQPPLILQGGDFTAGNGVPLSGVWLMAQSTMSSPSLNCRSPSQGQVVSPSMDQTLKVCSPSSPLKRNNFGLRAPPQSIVPCTFCPPTPQPHTNLSPACLQSKTKIMG